MLHRVKAIRTRFEASFWSDSLEHGLNIIHSGGLTLQSVRAPILRIYTNPSPIFLTLILGSRCVVQILQFPDHESLSCSAVVRSCVSGDTVWAGQAGKARITRAGVPDMFIKSGRTTWISNSPRVDSQVSLRSCRSTLLDNGSFIID